MWSIISWVGSLIVVFNSVLVMGWCFLFLMYYSGCVLWFEDLERDFNNEIVEFEVWVVYLMYWINGEY